MNLGLTQKRALVLGSSSGLGKAVAQNLVSAGCRVMLSGRDPHRLIDAQKETGAFSVIECDLNRPYEGSRIIKEATSVLGGIDILVTNTGGPKKGMFGELTDGDWITAFQSLFLASVDCAREAIKEMKPKQWGRILFITSVSAREPIAELTISSSLRAAQLAMVKTISKEVAASGITVNALLPGFMETARLTQLGIKNSDLIEQIPARRLGQADELGSLAAFLASTHAGYITGQAIAIDGGWMNSI
jgi:3-oxoacyl-[acyl-carrier protein] reductase